MREIKFRAWDKNKKVMYQVTGIQFENTPILINNNLFDELHERTQFINDTILMQYTGFKDCNGKEIYEGDIVKKDGESIGVIKWGHYCEENGDPCCDVGHVGFHAKFKENYGSGEYGLCNHSEWKVIGNIYENQ